MPFPLSGLCQHIQVKSDTFSSDVFFLSGFSFRYQQFTRQQGKGDNHLHSSLPLQPTHKHLNLYLHVWWLSHIFNHTACNYQATIWWYLPSSWNTIWVNVDRMLICLLGDLILDFSTVILTWKRGGFKFALTITLVLQGHQLTMWASHPKTAFPLANFVIFSV